MAAKFNYLTKNYFVTYGSSFIVLGSSHHSKLLAAKYNVHLTLGIVKGKVNWSPQLQALSKRAYPVP